MAVAALLCVFLWYNPVVWLWRRQLALAHEYEADSDVVDAGVDIKSYQILLIKKAVGTRLQSLANNLTHSKLKKRITMMCKKQSKGAALLRTLAIVPAIAGALAVANIPAVAAVVNRLSPSQSETVGEVTQNPSAGQELPAASSEDAVQLPSFPGGEMAMFQYLMENMRYPENASKSGVEGRVIVQFKVNADGTLSEVCVPNPVDPDLDAEAVRVVKSMPRWNPGKENGVAVAAAMVLPMEFKLK